MEKLTGQKVQFGYRVMDAGYGAKTIRDFILSCERIPITDPNKRGGENRPPLSSTYTRILPEMSNSYSHPGKAGVYQF
jgi:hypothetical protein